MKRIAISKAGVLFLASFVFAQDITVDSGGYVGIGTTSPNSELEVVGNVEADGFTINGIPVGTSSESFWSASEGNIYYNSGYVGIWTMFPAYHLDVAGTINASTAIKINGMDVLTSYTETDPFFAVSSAAEITSADIINWNTSYLWGDHTSAGYDVTNDSWTGIGDIYTTSGYVSIGTAVPGTLLQLETDGDAYLTLKNATDENHDGGAETRIIFEDHTNTTLARIQASHDGTEDDSKGDLIFSTHSGSALTERMRIDSTGNVSVAGTAEELCGTSSCIDYNDGGNGVIRLKSTNNTNNGMLDIDLETTAGVIEFSSNPKVNLQFTDLGFVATNTLKRSGDFQRGYSFTTTGSNGPALSPTNIYAEIISTDENNQSLLYGIHNRVRWGNTTHTGVNKSIGLFNDLWIDGVDASEITSAVATKAVIMWKQSTMDANMALSEATGYQMTLRAASNGGGSETLTLTDYNAFQSRSNGDNGDMTGDTWTGFRATDLSLPGPGPTSQIGVAIEDLQEGKSQYGIVLYDGGECTWSGWDPVEKVPNGTAFCIETVEISNTTLLNATAAPVTVIPARGTDTLLEYVSATLVFDNNIDYDCGVDDEMVFQYETTGVDVSEEFETDGFLDGGADAIKIVAAASQTDVNLVDNINKAIQLYQTNIDCTNGNGVMRAKITYKIHVLEL